MRTKTKPKFKKRYIAFALLAADFILLPLFGAGAVAHISEIKDKISSAKLDQIASVRLVEKPGHSIYIVTSNAPFVISAKEAQGDTHVEVQKSGHVYGLNIGGKAQMPGPSENCTFTDKADETIIYTADRQTMTKRGDTLEQSVIVKITYDAANIPDIKFKTSRESVDIQTGKSCAAASELSNA